MNSPPNAPHIAVCPSAGIGHLIPFFRLASMLATPNTTAHGGCKVTLVIIRPSLSTAESQLISTFLSTHPHISSIDFHLPPQQHPTTTTSTATTTLDPFLRQYAAVSNSAHLLIPHLSALSPPLSAVFSDILLTSGLTHPLAALGIPNFTLITSSARFLSFMASLPYTTDFSQPLVDIPKSDLPPPFLDPTHLFHQLVVTACRSLKYVKGILVNSFHFFERKTILDMQSCKGDSQLPPVYPIGPLWSSLTTTPRQSVHPCIHWLTDQPSESVVYVSFGSRTSLHKDQIKELGEGLEMSGFRFLWVIKTTIVDKQEKGEVKELLREGFLEKTRNRGFVVKGWVNQEEVLAHPSIGGFICHCGWNSVIEVTQRGIPVLAWPQHGDQRVNAKVVVEAGLGVWESEWGWGGEKVISGEEIANQIKGMMTNEKLRDSAKRVAKEARKALEFDGSSNQLLKMVINQCKRTLAT